MKRVLGKDKERQEESLNDGEIEPLTDGNSMGSVLPWESGRAKAAAKAAAKKKDEENEALSGTAVLSSAIQDSLDKHWRTEDDDNHTPNELQTSINNKLELLKKQKKKSLTEQLTDRISHGIETAKDNLKETSASDVASTVFNAFGSPLSTVGKAKDIVTDKSSMFDPSDDLTNKLIIDVNRMVKEDGDQLRWMTKKIDNIEKKINDCCGSFKVDNDFNPRGLEGGVTRKRYRKRTTRARRNRKRTTRARRNRKRGTRAKRTTSRCVASRKNATHAKTQNRIF